MLSGNPDRQKVMLKVVGSDKGFLVCGCYTPSPPPPPRLRFIAAHLKLPTGAATFSSFNPQIGALTSRRSKKLLLKAPPLRLGGGAFSGGAVG